MRILTFGGSARLLTKVAILAARPIRLHLCSLWSYAE